MKTTVIAPDAQTARAKAMENLHSKEVFISTVYFIPGKDEKAWVYSTVLSG